ncbi:MAG: LptF/LptG family permease [Holosporaceae bacterium]|nr:LptF/LptG family permease [Holosporaceae bacterium]
MQFNTAVFVSGLVFCVILLFDFAEVTRKYPISNLRETLFALKLSFLRTPSTFCEILPYVYFITATFSLWNLSRSHQITIMKSVGQSPQQILYPFLLFATLIATLWLFVIHPVGLFLEEKYYDSISSNGNFKVNRDIWIDCSQNHCMIFIRAIHGDKIEGLAIFNSEKMQRIFAQKAAIGENVWTLENVTEIDGDKIDNFDKKDIALSISLDLIKLLSRSPRKHDVYSLYDVRRIQRRDRVILRLYELEFHKLFANFFSFLLFALISAVICFPLNRYKTRTSIAVKMIFTAIFIRFINGMLESLSYGEVLPVQLASWAVLILLTCISVSLLIWREA